MYIGRSLKNSLDISHFGFRSACVIEQERVSERLTVKTFNLREELTDKGIKSDSE
jgi:hypothetical protein